MPRSIWMRFSELIYEMRQLGLSVFLCYTAFHRANIVSLELDVHSFMYLPWPAHFPDLNWTEQAWDMLGGEIYNIPEQLQTLVALANAVQAQWMAIHRMTSTSLLRQIDAVLRLQDLILTIDSNWSFGNALIIKFVF